jgi:hypothetical protein
MPAPSRARAENPEAVSPRRLEPRELFAVDLGGLLVRSILARKLHRVVTRRNTTLLFEVLLLAFYP